jgi:SRSO17 transposase
MSTSIVAATCPVPPCNLTPRDVESLVADLATYVGHFRPDFVRKDQAPWAHRYLQGLVSNLPRTSIEPMALAYGFPIRSMQAFSGQSPWLTAPLIQRHQQLVAQTLGEDDGVILIDESGMPKQGQHSAAVAPQYCGALGKVANCQVGVYVGYASRKGYTLLDGQLFVPEGWFDDDHVALREEVGIPDALTFQTKPELAVALVEDLMKRKVVPARWLAADALYGDSPAFRDAIAGLGLWYVTDIACSGDAIQRWSSQRGQVADANRPNSG